MPLRTKNEEIYTKVSFCEFTSKASKIKRLNCCTKCETLQPNAPGSFSESNKALKNGNKLIRLSERIETHFTFQPLISRSDDVLERC